MESTYFEVFFDKDDIELLPEKQTNISSTGRSNFSNNIGFLKL